MTPNYINKVFYIHGFGSSSQSEKVKALKEYCKTIDVEVIGLDYDSTAPRDQIIEKLIEDIQSQYDGHCIIAGTSLGAYYAIELAKKFTAECIVMNPCLAPSESLANLELNPKAVASYVGHDYPTIWACSVFLETGDELFDYRIAENHFKNNGVTVIEGGSHRFESLEFVFEKIKSYRDWEHLHHLITPDFD